MANLRVALLILLVAFAATCMLARASEQDIGFAVSEPDGHGLVEDTLDDEDLMMESESARRQLGGGGGHVSYGALNRNNVPCNKRGQSYYNCGNHQQVNPYHRGCTRATNCKRNGR